MGTLPNGKRETPSQTEKLQMSWALNWAKVKEGLKNWQKLPFKIYASDSKKDQILKNQIRKHALLSPFAHAFFTKIEVVNPHTKLKDPLPLVSEQEFSDTLTLLNAKG